jgi:hypothetical protein
MNDLWTQTTIPSGDGSSTMVWTGANGQMAMPDGSGGFVDLQSRQPIAASDIANIQASQQLQPLMNGLAGPAIQGMLSSGAVSVSQLAQALPAAQQIFGGLPMARNGVNPYSQVNAIVQALGNPPALQQYVVAPNSPQFQQGQVASDQNAAAVASATSNQGLNQTMEGLAATIALPALTAGFGGALFGGAGSSVGDTAPAWGEIGASGIGGGGAGLGAAGAGVAGTAQVADLSGGNLPISGLTYGGNAGIDSVNATLGTGTAAGGAAVPAVGATVAGTGTVGAGSGLFGTGITLGNVGTGLGIAGTLGGLGGGGSGDANLTGSSQLGTGNPSLGLNVNADQVSNFGGLGGGTDTIASGISNTASANSGLGGGSLLSGTDSGSLTNILSGLGTASGLTSGLSDLSGTSGLQNLLQSLQQGLGTGVGSGGATVGSTIPGLLALAYAAQQPGADTSQLQSVYNAAGSNQGGFVQAAQAPLLQSQAAGYGDLVQNQGLRGVLGSSFGDTDIANYLSTTGQGIANAGINATQGSLALQGNLAGQISQLGLQNQQIQNNLYGTAFNVLGRGLNPTSYIGASTS